jgi:hypothetical protein
MRYTLLIAFLLAAVPAQAQTIESVFDLSVLGWGALDTPQSVETDGDPDTREWLVRPVSQVGRPLFRVVTERGGLLCAGDWFNANGPESKFMYPLTLVTVQRVGRFDKLVVRQNGSSVVTVVALDTPVCH